MKNPQQIIIAKTPKIRKFDLSFKKGAENARILAAIETLKNNSGWHFLVQVFQENITYLSNQILTKEDEQGKPLTDAQIDVLRMKYAYLKELIEKPDRFVKQLSRQDTEEVDLDPYDKGERQKG